MLTELQNWQGPTTAPTKAPESKKGGISDAVWIAAGCGLMVGAVALMFVAKQQSRKRKEAQAEAEYMEMATHKGDDI